MPSEQVVGSTETAVSTEERYERGLALKNAGLYKAAIDQFEMAAASPALRVKAYAQMGLCHQVIGRCEDAVWAFQKALACSNGSTKETVQLLYVLGRTLELLGRVEETLEAYRWIRREDPGYRDVADRIEQLSSRRPVVSGSSKEQTGEQAWTDNFLKSLHGLLGSAKEG
jgi:tetratricopeptide (TPR) repeat protein